jgi:hypothetical protein
MAVPIILGYESQDLFLFLVFCLIYETLANAIKQNTQQKGKRRNKERDPKSEPVEQNPKWVIKIPKSIKNISKYYKYPII